MKQAYRKVLKFMRMAGDPIPETPQMLPVGSWGWNIALKLVERTEDWLEVPMRRGTKRMLWILREIIEFLEAETPEDQVDALCDILVLTLGTAVEMRHNPAKAFDLVMEANMQKVVDGVSRDEDGYIQKPVGWQSPQPKIRDEWNRQVTCSQNLYESKPRHILTGVSQTTMAKALAKEYEEIV